MRPFHTLIVDVHVHWNAFGVYFRLHPVATVGSSDVVPLNMQMTCKISFEFFKIEFSRIKLRLKPTGPFIGRESCDCIRCQTSVLVHRVDDAVLVADGTICGLSSRQMAPQEHNHQLLDYHRLNMDNIKI